MREAKRTRTVFPVRGIHGTALAAIAILYGVGFAFAGYTQYFQVRDE